MRAVMTALRKTDPLPLFLKYKVKIFDYQYRKKFIHKNPLDFAEANSVGLNWKLGWSHLLSIFANVSINKKKSNVPSFYIECVFDIYSTHTLAVQHRGSWKVLSHPLSYKVPQMHTLKHTFTLRDNLKSPIHLHECYISGWSLLAGRVAKIVNDLCFRYCTGQAFVLINNYYKQQLQRYYTLD